MLATIGWRWFDEFILFHSERGREVVRVKGRELWIEYPRAEVHRKWGYCVIGISAFVTSKNDWMNNVALHTNTFNEHSQPRPEYGIVLPMRYWYISTLINSHLDLITGTGAEPNCASGGNAVLYRARMCFW